MRIIETDPESGAEVWLLCDDPRPADNIYGEQPYASQDSGHIALRFETSPAGQGGLAILDLGGGSMRQVFRGEPRFPAFHAWGRHFYFQEERNGEIILRRCAYALDKTEDVARLDASRGRLSYGTVSHDERWYAVSVERPDGVWEVRLLDLASGAGRVLAASRENLFKHEQFSRDGRNRVLIQANVLPDTPRVPLGVLGVDQEGVAWLGVDQPHTPRPTGHEAWVGQTSQVFFSTRYDEARRVCVWTAGAGGAPAQPAHAGPERFGHVSVSRCGRYWLCDAPGEENVPIYAGSFETGACKRVLLSRTLTHRRQWGHTHPYLTADNRWLIFTSARTGDLRVYGARLPGGWLETL